MSSRAHSTWPWWQAKCRGVLLVTSIESTVCHQVDGRVGSDQQLCTLAMPVLARNVQRRRTSVCGQ
eukprot:3619347-Prymnesium_polylepis.1